MARGLLSNSHGQKRSPQLWPRKLKAKSQKHAPFHSIVDDRGSRYPSLPAVNSDRGGCVSGKPSSSGEEFATQRDGAAAQWTWCCWTYGCPRWTDWPPSSRCDKGHYPMVVMISGHSNIETTVQATKLGARLCGEAFRSKTTRSVKSFGFSARKTAASAAANITSRPGQRPHEALRRQVRSRRRPAAACSFGEEAAREGLVARAIPPQACANQQTGFVEVNCAAIRGAY